MITVKEVIVRKEDDGRGWQTLIQVELQFGTIDPHVVLMVVPQDLEASIFGKSTQAMIDGAKKYAADILTDAAAAIT